MAGMSWSGIKQSLAGIGTDGDLTWAGFGAGLVVGFFSQAIVFVSGLAMLTLHVSLLWERKRIPDVIYSIKTKHCRSYTDGGLIFPSCSG